MLVLAVLLLASCEDTKVEQNPLEAAAQGSPLSPLAISLPYNGTVGAGSSYYKVTGLVISSPNTIDLTGFSSDLDLRVGNDPTFTLPPVCLSANPGTTAESCTVTADGAGVLYVQVVNIAGGVVSFTLSTPGGGGLGAPTMAAPTPGNGQLGLAWTSVTGATSYQVYRGTTPGVTVTPPPLTTVASPTVTFTDTGLTNGTSYYYIVTAFDGVTESPASNEVSASPALPAPTGVTASPGNTQLTLAWNPVAGASSYTIYWSTTAGVTQGTGTPIAGAVSPHLHSGLANGTPYYYVVTALDTGESADSAPASATPAAGTTSLPLPGPVSGTAFPTGPDPFEGLPNDNASSGARAILVGDPPQARTLFPAGDEDWMRVDLAASTTYEFSANNLSIRGDTQLELYDAVPSLIFSNDDWVGLDSRVAYTTGPTPETVFLRVLLSPFAIPPDDLPVMTYSISARVFTDGDTDGYSPFYDCDDTKGAHYPYAPETAGDGIDQDCDQTDDLLPTTVDGVDSVFPGDDTVADAPSFSLASGSIYELQLRPETFVLNAHTLHLSTDVDYMWVNVSGYSQIDVSTLYDAVPNGLWLDWFAADGVTPLGSNSGALPALTLNNPNPGVTTFYLRFMAFDGSSTGYYVFAAEDLGVDVDGDGYYTRGGGLGWDCDDVKPGIYPGAPGEAAADGEDTNCNGLDDS